MPSHEIILFSFFFCLIHFFVGCVWRQARQYIRHIKNLTFCTEHIHTNTNSHTYTETHTHTNWKLLTRWEISIEKNAKRDVKQASTATLTQNNYRNNKFLLFAITHFIQVMKTVIIWILFSFLFCSLHIFICSKINIFDHITSAFDEMPWNAKTDRTTEKGSCCFYL